MNLKNRLSTGFIAGLIAGIVMDIIDHLTYLTIKSQIRSVDWVAILIYGHKSNNLLELILSQTIHFSLSAVLGIIFIVYFAPLLKNTNFLLKGWTWAILIWFFSNLLIFTFIMPGLTAFKLKIIVIHFILASVYGLVLAAGIRWLDNTSIGGNKK